MTKNVEFQTLIDIETFILGWECLRYYLTWQQGGRLKGEEELVTQMYSKRCACITHGGVRKRSFQITVLQGVLR